MEDKHNKQEKYLHDSLASSYDKEDDGDLKVRFHRNSAIVDDSDPLHTGSDDVTDDNKHLDGDPHFPDDKTYKCIDKNCVNALNIRASAKTYQSANNKLVDKLASGSLADPEKELVADEDTKNRSNYSENGEDETLSSNSSTGERKRLKVFYFRVDYRIFQQMDRLIVDHIRSGTTVQRAWYSRTCILRPFFTAKIATKPYPSSIKLYICRHFQ